MIEESESGVTGAGAQGGAAIGVAMNAAAQDASAAVEAREYLREQTEISRLQKAPNWGRLHLKWGEALYYVGKRDDARNAFAVASHLDLSPQDENALHGWVKRHD
ncbi:MAG TPA: hypothetical protein VF835_04615 [Rhizomicrobium sp.]